jgi:hypothetical protein
MRCPQAATRGCRRVPPRAQGREGVRGNYWFTETDLRNGVALRPDKTGKGLLMVLRHLGRISEVRALRAAHGGLDQGLWQAPGAPWDSWASACEPTRARGCSRQVRANVEGLGGSLVVYVLARPNE